MRLLLIIFLLFSSNLFAAEMSTEKMPKHDWSFKGVTGTFDRAAIQRGYKVYREVCAGCHSMKLLYYRDLIDIGFSEAQVKVIASEYTVLDVQMMMVKCLKDRLDHQTGLLIHTPMIMKQEQITMELILQI